MAMRQPRSRQFDPADPPWLHCTSRCVRRAFLCGDGLEHRKRWLERRLRLLSRCFAIRVGAYAIMSNHMHVVLRPRPSAIDGWTDEQVALAYWCVKHDVDPQDPEPDPELPQRPEPAHLERLIANAPFIGLWRQRLGCLSWFMKSLKEPLGRLANKEDDCSGSFWEGRFKSEPLLDQAAILACMAYVDLNPIRAELADVPERSQHTSIKTRIEERQAQLAAGDSDQDRPREESTSSLSAADPTTPSAPALREGAQAGAVPRPAWLATIPEITSSQVGDPGWQLDDYLQLVDLTGRAIRAGKRGRIPPELPALLARLDDGHGRPLAAQRWIHTLGTRDSLSGAAIGTIVSLAREAVRRGMQWLQLRCPLFDRQRPQSASPQIC